MLRSTAFGWRNPFVLETLIMCLVVGTACIDDPLPGGPSPSVKNVTVSGVVRDDVQAPIAAAQIQAVSAATIVNRTSDAEGRFSMTVPTTASGMITVRASKSGFVTAGQTQAAPSPNVIQMDFTLVRIGLRPGEFTLTVAAATTCDTLPPLARSRTYNASLVPLGESLFTLSLHGASFAPNFSVMYGNTYPNGNISAIFAGGDDFPAVGEILEDGGHLEFGGTAVFPDIVSDTISGPFNGWLSYCPPGASPNGFFSCTVPHASCTSPSHQMTLTRR